MRGLSDQLREEVRESGSLLSRGPQRIYKWQSSYFTTCVVFSLFFLPHASHAYYMSAALGAGEAEASSCGWWLSPISFIATSTIFPKIQRHTFPPTAVSVFLTVSPWPSCTIMPWFLAYCAHFVFPAHYLESTSPWFHTHLTPPSFPSPLPPSPPPHGSQHVVSVLLLVTSRDNFKFLIPSLPYRASADVMINL